MKFTNKIKSAINVFLNSDDFVVKPLIETETEIGFIIVSDLEKINQLRQQWKTKSTTAFLLNY
jgi:hypothetical protein